MNIESEHVQNLTSQLNSLPTIYRRNSIKVESYIEYFENIDGRILWHYWQCDYIATEVSNLKRHKEYEHEGIKYPCDMCE